MDFESDLFGPLRYHLSAYIIYPHKSKEKLYKSANLTEHLDRMYTDRLSGLLPEEDFQRIFTRIKDERAQLEERIKELQQQQKNPISQTERAKDLVQRYLDTAYANRELLVSLIERIELTAAREIIVKFRFAELQQAG